MKVKLAANAELDMLTHDELNQSLKKLMEDWRVEAAKGPRFIRFSSQGTVASDGSLTIGGQSVTLQSGRLGPEASMIWSVKRVTITGLDLNSDKVSLYINTVSNPGGLVIAALPGYQKFGSDELVLKELDRLVFFSPAVLEPPGTVVTVSGAALELPHTMEYLLA